jgi:uncharacterized protein (DUF305 family)
MMTAHHEGAIAMAKTEIRDGENADMALAQSMVRMQQQEITVMKDLLSKL